jgi:aspartate/methionine/tyrosine aminotransferase
MASFQPFDLERVLSKYENAVEYNLSESGVQPILLRELIDDPAGVDELLATELNYPPTDGVLELRENIGALYPEAGPENVLVTVGGSEANYISLQALVQPGDEIAVMVPNYMQIWGCAVNAGIHARVFHLREETGWGLDLDELSVVVSPKTKLVNVCNPNNPTGYVLAEDEMDGVVEVAARAGAWLLADEVYRGAERLSDADSPTFWGRYDKVLAVGSLSKAYGLPGLRLGWVVAPAHMVDELLARHEYLTIAATALGNKLAALALSPDMRPRIIARARDYIRRGFSVFEEWLGEHEGVFSLVSPQAAAVAFPRYHLDINSTELSERLIREKSVFIVPGDTFGLDHFVRISYGLPEDYLCTALDRIHEFIVGLKG